MFSLKNFVALVNEDEPMNVWSMVSSVVSMYTITFTFKSLFFITAFFWVGY
jgi:hypothetical protein